MDACPRRLESTSTGTRRGGRIAVAQLVDGDRREPCGVGVVPDAAQQQVRADRTTELVDEHPAGIGPQLTDGEPVLALRPSVLTECVDGGRVQRDRPLPRVGLRAVLVDHDAADHRRGVADRQRGSAWLRAQLPFPRRRDPASDLS